MAANSAALLELAHANKNRALRKRDSLSLRGILIRARARRASSKDQEGTTLEAGGFLLNVDLASILQCLCSKSIPEPSLRGSDNPALIVRTDRASTSGGNVQETWLQEAQKFQYHPLVTSPGGASRLTGTAYEMTWLRD